MTLIRVIKEASINISLMLYDLNSDFFFFYQFYITVSSKSLS